MSYSHRDTDHAAALSCHPRRPTRASSRSPQIVEQLSRRFLLVLTCPAQAARRQSRRHRRAAGQRRRNPNILRYCHAHDLPVTIRGAGTGNYGQAVPLHGGIVLDLARMDHIEAIQPGRHRRLRARRAPRRARNEGRESGWELRCYPSTIVKATLGGFLGGGSGGIGSVAHGNLRDFDTVARCEVVTMEAEPRVVLHEGQAVHEILHAWGTNGVITRSGSRLLPRSNGRSASVAFDTFDAAFDFQRENRVRTPIGPSGSSPPSSGPSPSFFGAGAAISPAAKQIADLLYDCRAAAGANFERPRQQPVGKLRSLPNTRPSHSRPLLSDYTWNHTTLWAMKPDD